MTITTTATSSGPYTATGQTTFAVTFQSAGVGELQVLLNGTVVSPTLYTHSRNADGTGSVVFAAPQTGTILINSVPSFQQQVSFNRYGAFYPDQINSALDRAAARSLYLQSLLSRSILSPVGETLGLLPAASVRANGLLGFDSLGNIIPYSVPAGGVAPTLVAGTLAGRGSASGAGFYEGITIGSGLALTNKVLSLAAGGLAVVTPEAYGAQGDGTTNDTVAFQNMAAAINTAGGGIINFAIGKTYLVGGQTFGAAQTTGRFTKYTGVPQLLIELNGLTKPIIIFGNGAKIKLISGGKYGTFNPDGTVLTTTLPYYGNGITCYYDSVFLFTSCSDIAITDLEIDGSMQTAVLGGGWGDTGYQLGGNGIKVVNPQGRYFERNVNSHHHTSDGSAMQGSLSSSIEGDLSTMTVIQSPKRNNNGRLGMSITGGRGFRISDGQFNYNANQTINGAGTVSSAPKSGCDIEPDIGRQVRDVLYDNCEFLGNQNTGQVCDNGDTKRVQYRNCRFTVTTSGGAAVWPNKPRLKFFGCVFAGTVVQLYRTDPTALHDFPVFEDCISTTDPFFAPLGQTLQLSNGLWFDQPTATGVNFYRHTFDGVKDGAGGGFSGDSGGVAYGPNLIDCTVIARGVNGTASMSGNTLTVTALTTGSIYIGQTVTVGGVSVVISAFGPLAADSTRNVNGQVAVGNPGLGSYTFSGATQTVASGPLTSVGAQPTLGGRFKGNTNFIEYGTGSIQLLPYNNFSGTDPARNKAWANAKTENGFGYTNNAGTLVIYPASFSAEDRKNVYWGQSATYTSAALAVAASTPIQTLTVNGCAVGDKIAEKSFTGILPGIIIHAEVTAANTVSWWLTNQNGSGSLTPTAGVLNVKIAGA